MTDYEVTIPDWGTFEVNGAPPDLTKEQLIDIIKQKNSSRGIVNQGILGGVSGFAQFLEMLPQLPFMQFGPVGMEMARRFTPDIQKMLHVKREPGALNAPVTTGEEFARTTGEFLGNPSSYIGGGSGTIKNIVGKAADAVLGAVGSEGMHQLAKAANFGPVGDALSQFAGALIGPGARNLAKGAPRLHADPVHDEMVDALRDKYGISPTAGDVRGSKSLRRAESTLGAVPFSFGAAEREDIRVGQEVSNAILRLMGDTTTDMKNPNARFRDALLAAKQRFDADFSFVADQLKIRYDKPLSDQLTKILQDAFNEGLSEDQLRRIQAMTDEVTRRAVTGRRYQIDGENYLAMTEHGSALSRAMDEEGPIGFYATKVRTAIDDAMERTADKAVRDAYTRGQAGGQARARAQEMAQALETLRTVRRQYFTYLTAAKAFGSAGQAPKHGRLSAQRLSAILNAGDDNKMRNVFERSDLRELSEAASGVISNLANSSTAERGLTLAAAENIGHRAGNVFTEQGGARAGVVGAAATTGGVLGGIPGALIGFATPGLTGRAILSPPVQKWLKRRADPLRLQRMLGPAATATERAETEILPPGGAAPSVSQAHAAEGPRLPGELGPVRPEAPGEGGGVGPIGTVPSRYGPKAPNARLYQKWSPEELEQVKAGEVPEGRTQNQVHRQRQLRGWAKPRIPEEPPLESQPGFAKDVLGTKPGAGPGGAEPASGAAPGPRQIPRITVQALPPEQRSPEAVLDNPEGDPLQ